MTRGHAPGQTDGLAGRTDTAAVVDVALPVPASQVARRESRVASQVTVQGRIGRRLDAAVVLLPSFGQRRAKPRM